MKLGSEYTDLKYSLGNTYEMTINVIDNPFPFGKLFSLKTNFNTLTNFSKMF